MDENKLNDESARAAAKWWADRLRYGAKLDHGARTPDDFVAPLLGTYLQRRSAKDRTEEQIQAFEDALFEELMERKMLPITYIAGIDYHPTGVFVRAAEKAGIRLGGGCLPWKTHMYYMDGKVKVSYGYGAPIEDIDAMKDGR